MKPNVGMVYPVSALVDTYTPGTSISYKNGIVVAEARGATLNWERSDGSFYGDDTRLDSDVGAVGYTLDFEPSGLKSAVRAQLLGEVLVTTDQYRVTGDNAPDVGFGYVRVMREDVDGVPVTRYEAWWFYKLKFAINSEETRTKERNIEWRTPTLQGVGDGVSLDSTGTLAFATHKTFDTLAGAISYVNGKAGIT